MFTVSCQSILWHLFPIGYLFSKIYFIYLFGASRATAIWPIKRRQQPVEFFNRFFLWFSTVTWLPEYALRGNKLIKTRVSASTLIFHGKLQLTPTHTQTHRAKISVNDLFDNKHSWTHSLSQKGSLDYGSARLCSGSGSDSYRCKWSSTKRCGNCRRRLSTDDAGLSACVAESSGHH